jgi:hypothetical protein
MFPRGLPLCRSRCHLQGLAKLGRGQIGEAARAQDRAVILLVLNALAHTTSPDRSVTSAAGHHTQALPPSDEESGSPSNCLNGSERVGIGSSSKPPPAGPVALLPSFSILKRHGRILLSVDIGHGRRYYLICTRGAYRGTSAWHGANRTVLSLPSPTFDGLRHGCGPLRALPASLAYALVPLIIRGVMLRAICCAASPAARDAGARARPFRSGRGGLQMPVRAWPIAIGKASKASTPSAQRR